MTSPAVLPLITELDDAVKNGSSERRVRMLKRVTDLFLSDSDRLNEQQITVFDDVLLRLVERVEARTLSQISVSFSDIKRAPSQVVRQLAKHEEISVAGPLLAKSNRLADNDLVAVAEVRSQDHMLAISLREKLNEPVTDVLLQLGNIRVSYALAENTGARFSPYGYSALADRAQKDEGLAEKVGVRVDTPIDILKTLLRKATDAVRSRMMRSARPDIRDRIQSAIDEIAKGIGNSVPVSIDYTKSEIEVFALNRVGGLNEAAVGRFARDREYDHCIVALSLLTSTPVNIIAPVFYGSKPDGLIIACRAAKLGWATTLMILRSRPGLSAASLLDLEQSRQVFQALSLSSAERTLRGWSAKGAAKKANAPKTLVAMSKV